jgi:glycosyltransferase involved in cell wall biosynthesis
MKIVYIIGTLATQSGAARIVTEKMNLFASRLHYDITVITCIQHQNEKNTYPLSDTIKQINLNIPFFSQYKYRYPKRIWVKWSVYRLMYDKITKTVNHINPDIVIGFGQYHADVISCIKSQAKIIIECHEIRFLSLPGIKSYKPFPYSILYKLSKYRYYRTIEQHADAIATLTEKDKLLWKKAKRVEVIPNFSMIQVNKVSDCTSKRIISIGRLEKEKGYERLIEIWRIVSLKHPDWQLDIFGEGEMEGVIRQLIKTNGVKNICIHKFTHDISQEYAKSSICALTSYYEGFSLILLEAQKHGVPCVAFDCPFGPRTIINDAYNGFLVENGDIRSFADRVCRLIENQDLRKQFSQAGIEHAKNFDFRIIIQKWKELFDSLT